MAEQKLPDKAQENEMKREKVRVVPIKYIDDSPDHPFLAVCPAGKNPVNHFAPGFLWLHLIAVICG